VLFPAQEWERMKTMRRNKEWWARLGPEERRVLVYLESAQYHSGRSDYIPDDCVECGGCGSPTLGWGLCPLCSEELQRIRLKGDGYA
jgi:hypothetical protein